MVLLHEMDSRPEALLQSRKWQLISTSYWDKVQLHCCCWY